MRRVISVFLVLVCIVFIQMVAFADVPADDSVVLYSETGEIAASRFFWYVSNFSSIGFNIRT